MWSSFSVNDIWWNFYYLKRLDYALFMLIDFPFCLPEGKCRFTYRYFMGNTTFYGQLCNFSWGLTLLRRVSTQKWMQLLITCVEYELFCHYVTWIMQIVVITIAKTFIQIMRRTFTYKKISNEIYFLHLIFYKIKSGRLVSNIKWYIDYTLYFSWYLHSIIPPQWTSTVNGTIVVTLLTQLEAGYWMRPCCLFWRKKWITRHSFVYPIYFSW